MVSARVIRALSRLLTAQACLHYHSGRVPNTSCPRCHVNGFVRREYVVKGATAVVRYDCGRCDHVWTVGDERRAKRPDGAGVAFTIRKRSHGRARRATDRGGRKP